MTEYMDIYNKDRQPTGEVVDRDNSFLLEGQYQMYVTIIVQNAEGKFLITRRALDKHWAAGWWEVSGGGVRAGETVEQAVVREVREEVGLDISHVQPELLCTYENVDLERGDNYFMNIFRVQLDFQPEDVCLQEEETIDFRLATWDDICNLNDQDIFLHFKRIAAVLGKQ